MNLRLQDLRYAFRVFRKNVVLTLVILASLGIGIGANSAIFSVVDALLLRPLPFPHPDRLAAVWLHSPNIGILRDWPSPGQYIDIQNQNHSFDQMAIAQSRTFTLTGREQPERVDVLSAQSSLLAMFGAKPLLGRTLLPEEDQPGRPAIPAIHAVGSDLIQVALIGCGGRGGGAAANALSVKRGPVKLVAMADIFPDRLQKDLTKLQVQFASQVDVPPERQFIGFDAYQKAMDCLKPGDIAIFATPPAFRWVHFAYAIQKRLNVFMEKPLTTDGPTSKRMFSLAHEAQARNLKGGVGLMSRHNRSMQELAKRVHDGEIGEIILQRGYRMHGPGGYFSSVPKPAGITDLLYQVQRFHSFIWASGGCFNDFYIHLIDQLGWMKNEWPVKAQALGGRQYRFSAEGIMYVDQNFDTYSVEYTYSDGTKFFFDGRTIPGCEQIYSSYLHGTKGSGIASKAGDCGQPSSLYASQNLTANMFWESQVKPEDQDPYQNEWNDLVDAIRDDKPYNEVQRGVEASLVSSMGRMAAHTGREMTYDQMLNCDFEMSPNTDKFTMDSPAPLVADADGRYPVPQPGIVTSREYRA